MLIAQLSDPHLRRAGVLYQDVADTNALFAQAVAQVNELDPQPDLVLLTGDLTAEGDPAEYAIALDLLAHLRAPLLAIPGNHDEREAFRTAFLGRSWLPAEGPIHYVVEDAGPVRVVALDVTVPGLHHGEAGIEALAWLDRTLAMRPAQPTVLMMHHPPIACGIPYLDEYRCFGAQGLADVIGGHRQVERILCGHVHRLMQARFAGTMLCTAPSTGTSIALRLRADAEPASYLEPPGFLLHRWDERAGIVTHLVPLGTFAGPFPFF